MVITTITTDFRLCRKVKRGGDSHASAVREPIDPPPCSYPSPRRQLPAGCRPPNSSAAQRTSTALQHANASANSLPSSTLVRPLSSLSSSFPSLFSQSSFPTSSLRLPNALSRAHPPRPCLPLSRSHCCSCSAFPFPLNGPLVRKTFCWSKEQKKCWVHRVAACSSYSMMRSFA